ncbi:hypothetical protein NFHSH190041_05340 [Shewanella sp. NFH-SH190041]|uniref:MSHA biogenesis protein MshK n=1 Tax=Shewanella sp. NFH-SH190041 TaxID=2950245 RepID=UPI0021C2ED7D|nr:MSHA biogenesis protein MshK [Shewanella sp. NFH-SH190041]BDM63082.1 hypothetical protein NFHSH190041_05340 [Shewanella sp. NFH-SH190041]
MLQIKPFVSLVALLMCSNALAQPLKDPTRPAVVTGKQSRGPVIRTDTGLVLNSIVKSPQQSYAVINSRIYHLGSSVRGVRIMKISEDHVLLADGRRLTLFTSVIGK